MPGGGGGRKDGRKDVLLTAETDSSSNTRFLSIAFLISVIVFCLPVIRADVQGDLQKQQQLSRAIKNQLCALIGWCEGPTPRLGSGCG